MNIYFDKWIEKFGLDHLDHNPLLIRTQKCLQGISKDYKLDHRFKIKRPSYVFMLLIVLAIVITIVKVFQTLTLLCFVLLRLNFSLKNIAKNQKIQIELRCWLLLGLLLLLHIFISKIDCIAPFIQIFIYNIPWFQDYKYTRLFFEQLEQICPQVRQEIVQESKIEDERLLHFTEEAQKQYRAFLRI